MDQKVTNGTQKAVRTIGFRRTNWLLCAQAMIVLLFVLNFMACYARPDLLTQLVCGLGLLHLTGILNMRRSEFRMLPFVLFVSIIYDVIYFVLFESQESEIRPDDGQVRGWDVKVKRFAR